MADTNQAIDEFMKTVPKAELHLHIEGSFEPELIFRLAQKNNITLKHPTVEELKKTYQHFTDLQSFLDVYYSGMSVLKHEEDFYELAAAYWTRVVADGVQHAEIFFDPQEHTARGIPYSAVVRGLHRACEEAVQKYGVSYLLIPSIVRHLSEEEGLKILAEITNPEFRPLVHGLGLDSSELPNPPAKYANIYAKAKEAGLRLTAHAAEEGPPSYLADCLDILKVERIDHGVRVMEDPELVQRCKNLGIAFTVCPLSNCSLKCFDSMSNHSFDRMWKAGLKVTINSDDPAYFGGYILENFKAVQRAFSYSAANIAEFAINSIEGSWAAPERKAELVGKIKSQLVAFESAGN